MVIIVIIVIFVAIVIIVNIAIIVIIVPRFDESYSEIQLHSSLLVDIYHIHFFYVYGWNQLVFLCLFITHSPLF